MIQRRNDLDLAGEPVGAEQGAELRTKDLKRHLAAVFEIVGQIDCRHAALPQLAPDGVASGDGSLEAFQLKGAHDFKNTVTKRETVLPKRAAVVHSRLMSTSPELATLTALAQALSRPASLAESLDAALATVTEALGLETGWVWLLDDDSDEPRLAAARALPPALQGQPAAMRGDCYCLSTFRAGDLRGAANVNVVWCSRLAEVVSGSQYGEGTGDLRCHASIPLAVGERHLGMVNVASRDWRVLSQDELNLLTTAGAMISLAVERSRLEATGARAVAAEERNRLAREIHDTIAQSLAALTMQLEVVDARANAGGDQRLSDAAARSLELARSALDEARRSVLELRATPLERDSLAQALEQLARSGPDADGLEVRVAADEPADDDLPVAVAIGLYRIAQQALANIRRHANAHHATIRLERSSEQVKLRVEDDGTGFDPAAVPSGHFGLTGMRERARLLGGTLSLESAPGSGTVVEVEIPR
jgi:two-component system, NarL family, sensor kinase